MHGLEIKRRQNVIDSLISITENILLDIPEDYLLFLQDMFPYLEKYLVTDYLPRLVERIEYVMKQDINVAPDKTTPQQSTCSCCDRALLLDYKAELFLIKNDYKNALKKRLKAVSVLESYHTEENIITEVMEADNDYAKTVYLYLNKLYSRWQETGTGFSV